MGAPLIRFRRRPDDPGDEDAGAGPTRPRRPPTGTVVQRLDDATIRSRLDEFGDEARYGLALDERVGQQLPQLRSLSDLTSPLVVSYVERVARPVSAMPLATGARIMARGYMGHLIVEEDPGLVGAEDVPVLGTLPPLRRGRPPQDLLSRVVKVSRRQFWPVCALSPDGWDAFSLVSTAHVHDEAELAGIQDDDHDDDDDEEEEEAKAPAYLDESLVDGLLRAGWVLRQVDLAYGLEPDRREG